MQWAHMHLLATLAGMLLFGEILRNSGLNWSPALMLTGKMRLGNPLASFGVCQAKRLSRSCKASGSDENQASSSPGAGTTRP
jgi:hypothetical protein